MATMQAENTPQNEQQEEAQDDMMEIGPQPISVLQVSFAMSMCGAVLVAMTLRSPRRSVKRAHKFKSIFQYSKIF
jgi:hypothetical protein